MNAEQKAAFEWAKNQNFQSVAARYAKTLADLIESLTAQLAESQRRADAAVEQIEQQMIFDAGMGREPCEICTNAEKTPCIYCKPKWRGPQDRKGAAE